jgi:flavin-dependent dehydrogenase
MFLRQRGRDVLLLDEARFPRDKICGEAVSPEAWRFLDLLGLADSVRALDPHPLRGMVLVAPDGTTFQGDYRDRCGMAVGRRDLDFALLRGARAAGVDVREETRVTEAVVESGCVRGVVAERRGGPLRIHSRLVIVADGRRSVLARRLGRLSPHPRLRKFAVRGHWEGMEGLGDRGEMHVGGGGYCGIAPLSATRANVAFVLDRGVMEAAAGDLEGFFRSAMRQRWPRIAERLSRAALVEEPQAIGPLALVARRVSTPGALLVGDAAGFYDPFTGEGVTLALQSARIAADVAEQALAAGTVSDLGAYDARRRAATEAKFRFNRMLQFLVAHPQLANRMARRLARRPDLADRLVRVAGDFVPARAVLGPGFLWRLLLG